MFVALQKMLEELLTVNTAWSDTCLSVFVYPIYELVLQKSPFKKNGISFH